MPTIEQTYINALLADATYADELITGTSSANLMRALSPSMTPTLAQYLADNFTVASAINTPDSGDGSGFDAVVWRGNAGGDYAGKVYVSMRGTEGVADWLTDVNLALSSYAGQQVIDMINWWLRISTPPSTYVNQYFYADGAWSTASAFGQGLVTPAELAAGVEVNGHSLGGYLAAAFTCLFGTQAHVSRTSTFFNRAGFQPGSEAVFTLRRRTTGNHQRFRDICPIDAMPLAA